MKHIRFFKPIAILSLLFQMACCQLSVAQSPWEVKTRASFGANFYLMNIFRKTNFPGVRVYAAAGVSGIKGHLMLNYGPSISIYTRTVGANLNRFAVDYQIDFTNSLAIGYVNKAQTSHVKGMRTMHNGDYHNLFVDRENAFLLGTNMVLNNHGRHQSVGFLNLNIKNFSLNYYNDGPPYNWLGLGDAFDRYWTGGGSIIVHGAPYGNWVEFSYDQFTGYEPLLYELSNILGIPVPLYDEDKSDGTKVIKNFNTSAYHLKVNGGRYFDFDAGVLGNLVYKQKIYLGIQDIIHKNLRMSLHPNTDRNRFFIGGSYKYSNDVSF